MSNCLLCQENKQQRQLFSHIFFLKQEVATVCEDCTAQFHPISDSTCRHCCKESQEDICKDCQYWQQQGESVCHHALYRYTSAMKEYFSLYKFQGDYCLRKVFAKEVKLYLSQQKDYTIVPIPISQERYEERGFNQVTGILDAATITYQSLLNKQHSQKQSEKTRLERLEAEQVFYIEENASIPQKIILVDDIYTTGATLQLAKKLLMKKGAKIVKSFSIAR